MRDGTIDQPGHYAAILNVGSEVRALQWLTLEPGTPTPAGDAAAAGSARLSASTEPWQDLLAAPGKLVLWGSRLTPGGVELPAHTNAMTHEESSDGAIRGGAGIRAWRERI